MPWQTSVLLTLAATLSAVGLEAGVAALRGRRVYRVRDTLTNVSAYLLYLVIAAFYGYVTYLLMTYLQLHFRLHAAAGLGALYWPCLIVAEDLCFYWFHRASHKIGFLWASHVTHHSSDQFNLSVGLRQTWIPFVALPFWLPLACAGFEPVHILLTQSASLTYQFLMHTQLLNLPRVWGFVFNTPSHHRVHHGRNAEYLDRNFAGVFIVWDRFFGTFAREKSPVVFGVTNPPGRCEVLFVELAGYYEWLKQFWVKAPATGGESAYAAQKFSPALALLFLLACSAAFAAALMKPRWFI